jgi:hypothetical protein
MSSLIFELKFNSQLQIPWNPNTEDSNDVDLTNYVYNS